MKKGGLGKGLSALIPESGATAAPEVAVPNEGGDPSSGLSMAADARLATIAVADVLPNQYQPRRFFDDEKMAELTLSIQEVGVLQPILVRQTDGGYELVAGERRWRAAKRAGLTTIPALVREGEDRDSLEQAIVENLHRDDLNPLEEAAAFHRLMDEFGLTQHQVAVRVGRSRPAVANSLRLLHLPDSVQERIMDGTLGAGHARALAGLGDRQLVERLARRVSEEGLSVRQVEDLVRSIDEVGETADEDPPTPPTVTRDAALLEVERILGERFDTTVRVQSRGKKGRIVVEFADRDDLQRLFELLGG
ncbi:MAG: chromosome partitioning protein ParB [Acidimicrobiaceae bacterium]|nr:chromosome partitioning protein ParB [Acidimicrobiaceae bacterium]